MKQRALFLALAILLVVSAPSWAQINFSSWGRVVITPLAFSDKYSAVSAATSTWYDVPYVSFSANGTAPSKNIGFNIDFDFGYNIQSNGYNIVGDNAKIWVKPLGLLLPNMSNMLKLVAGRFYEDELRGKVGATEFGSWTIPNGSKDEDNIFTRLKASAGAYVRLEPLTWWDNPWNGLTLHAVFGSNALGAFGNNLRAILNLYNNEANHTNSSTNYEGSQYYDGERNTSAADVYRAGQYAIGYRIPDIGLARFQYIGSNRYVWRINAITDSGITESDKQLVTGIYDREGGAQKSADTLEFAFLYDGLKGLRVDVGVKLPLEFKTDNTVTVWDPIFWGILEPSPPSALKSFDYTVQLPRRISLGVNWTPSFLEELNIQTRFDCSFGGKIVQMPKGSTGNDITSREEGATYNFWFTPSYKILSALTLGVDFGMEIKEQDKLVRLGNPLAPEITAVTEWTDFGFAPWFELAVGGGKVRTGFVVMIPGIARFKNDNADGSKVNPKFLGDPVMSIPISITYSF